MKYVACTAASEIMLKRPKLLFDLVVIMLIAFFLSKRNFVKQELLFNFIRYNR